MPTKSHRLYYKLFDEDTKPQIDIVDLKAFTSQQINLHILRDDLNHTYVSGNKLRKLKYPLKDALDKGYTKLLSFGGAYSNHIHATAYAAHQLGLEALFIIRGEEYQTLNPTLKDAQKWGASFVYIDRVSYKRRYDADFLDQLKAKYPDYYIIPEGGKCDLAIPGCEEIILFDTISDYDVICSACGTATTFAGILSQGQKTQSNQQFLGFSALKGAASGLKKDVELMIGDLSINWDILDTYSFKGFARYNNELIDFVYAFADKYKILLDHIYTSKMLFGILDLIKNEHFENGSSILAVHTGGLQGLRGLDEKSLNKLKSLEIFDNFSF